MAVKSDLTLLLEDRPGIVARVGEALGAAGINIEGISGIGHRGQGILHVLVEPEATDAARRALEDAGVDVESISDAWVAQCADRPGELGRLMRLLADADVNLGVVYLTTRGQVVIAGDNLDQVTSLLC